MNISVKWLWKGACFCFGLFDESNSCELCCALSIWRRRKLASSQPPFGCGCATGVCARTRLCRTQRCRKMLKYELKTLQVNDFKVCGWQREGRGCLSYRRGTNATLQRSQDDVRLETSLAMNETALLCFPPGAECLKTADTSCSVAFLLFFLWLLWASVKWKNWRVEIRQRPLKHPHLQQLCESCDIIRFWFI